jgi:HEAT repeat protein
LEVAVGLANQGQAAATVVPVLIEGLKSAEPYDRRQAAVALGQLGPEGRAAGRVLLELMGGRTDPYRLTYAKTLVRIKADPGVVVPALLEMARSDGTLRFTALETLGDLGPDAKEAAPTLESFLQSAETRDAAADALWRVDRSSRDLVLPVFVRILQRAGDVPSKARVAEDLGAMGLDAKQAVPLLEPCLQSQFANVRVAAATALWRVTGRAEASIPVLVEGLHDRTVTAACDAARGLGEIGPPAKDAVPALLMTLKHPDATVREAAADALKKIDPEAAKKAGGP